jgi:hypothetical protein
MGRLAIPEVPQNRLTPALLAVNEAPHGPVLPPTGAFSVGG